MNSFERQYADSLKRVLNEGVKCHNRTGVDAYTVQHQDFIIEDIMNNFPGIKGKKVYPLMALKEILWMCHGRTDVKWLQDRGVTYWDEWAQEDGTIGKSYGYQYRNFNGIDQLQKLINDMIEYPESRRLILNLWNVNELDEMALAPCVYDFNFNCFNTGDNHYDVNLHVHVRSNDAFLGVPYDFMYAAWFLHIICKYISMYSQWRFNPKNIYYTADNYHIYVNHIDQVKEYLKNTEENKDDILSIPIQLLGDCVLDTRIMGKMSFDEYLDKYEFVATKNKIVKLVPVKDLTFEYGPIKAPVAV